MKKRASLMREESGSITMMTVIMMAAFIGLMAMVIDLGHLHVVQNELWNAADACALRGARAYLPDDLTGVTSTTPNPDNAKSEASLTIVDNKSDDKSLSDLPIADIQVGIWNCETSDWVGGTPVFSWPPDPAYWGHAIGPGIKLPTKRTTSYNAGPVTMTLANVFGVSTVPVATKATAYLSPMGGFTPESPTLPFGTWPANIAGGAGTDIHGQFRNDTSDNLGWTNLDPNDTNPNANEIKKLLTGALKTPDCPTGSTVGIQNGVASSCIQTMCKPANRFGLVETSPNVYTPDEFHADNIYMMPVFECPDMLDKFNHSSVVGAVPVKIISVSGPPDNVINVQVVGGSYSAPGYGGGKWYGILSNVPKLVQ